MAKAVLIVATVAAIVLRWAFGPWLMFGVYSLPLVEFVIAIWLWRMTLGSAVWFGLLLGMIVDAPLLAPFGVSSVLFMIMAFEAAGLRAFFSNTDSRLTQGLCIVLLAGTAVLIQPSIILALAALGA